MKRWRGSSSSKHGYKFDTWDQIFWVGVIKTLRLKGKNEPSMSVPTDLVVRDFV